MNPQTRCAHCGQPNTNGYPLATDSTGQLACFACFVPDISDPKYRGATEDFVTCGCGHRRADHQSGEGAYTGWCSGTLATMADADEVAVAVAAGGDPAEPCACEAFVPDCPFRPANQSSADHIAWGGCEYCVEAHACIEHASDEDGQPVCQVCRRVLERAGDALVVPTDAPDVLVVGAVYPADIIERLAGPGVAFIGGDEGEDHWRDRGR